MPNLGKLTKAGNYAGKKPGEWSIKITENVTPTVTFVSQNFQKGVLLAFKEYGERIKQEVRKGYGELPGTAPANKLTTMALKHGGRVLRDSGKLEAMVMAPGGVRVEEISGQYSVTISWNIPTSGGTGVAPQYRMNQDFLYLFAHEGIGPGNLEGPPKETLMRRVAVPEGRGFKIFEPSEEKRLPLRRFFFPGIKTGMKEGHRDLMARLSVLCSPAVTEKFLATQLPMGGYLHYEPFEFQIAPTMLYPMSIVATALYFTPPTKLLAYVGAVSDLSGAWAGTFTEKMIYGYMRQMAWGRMGISGKTYRRKFRRRMWKRE